MVQEKWHLKLFLSWSSGSPFVQRSLNLCNFIRGYYEEQFCEIILYLGQWFRRCPLKDCLFGALTALRLGERNLLSNFERGHHGEYSCEVI